MDTRANYALIGIFTVAAIVAAFGFVYWFSGADRARARVAYKVEFQGSVAGLAKGSAVLFNGIRVGDVNEVFLDRNRPDQAFAKIDVSPETPVNSSTKARLDTQILSGSAAVSLNGGAADAPPIVKRPDDDLPVIVAESGGIGSLLETARLTAEKANQLLDSVQGVVTENREALNRTVRNVEAFSDVLGKSAPGIDRLMSSLAQAADNIGPVAQKLQTLTDNTNALVVSIDRQKVANIITNVDNTLQTVNDSRARITNILQDTSTLMRGLADTAPKLDQTIQDAGKLVAAIDTTKISQVVDNTQRFTTALANSSRDVEQTARNANSLTAKLDAAAGRVDGVLKAAENFLGSAAGEEGKSTFGAVRLAAESIKRTSDNLDKRFTEITSALTRLAGTGTRQLDAVAIDARRTINTVGRAASNLERNPSSVIFGGGRAAIPEYSGR
ncbi:MAG: MCE family protein [Methylobacteriaceae bacterium]|nr:MCE family protein [Methylobacteriaceae bacterium]